MIIGDELISTPEGIEVEDPSTGRVIGSVPAAAELEVDRAVEAAHAALRGPWSRIGQSERSQALRRIATTIRGAVEELARWDSLETGKPLSSARGSTVACAQYFDYYAGVADKLEGRTIPVSPASLDFTVLEPMGVTAHIVPWNVPLSILGRSLAPALAAGNTAIIKASEVAPLAVLRMLELVKEAGILPTGVVNAVTGYGSAGEALVCHPLTDLVVFTGSVATGSKVMAGAAANVTPVVLELGGKAPFIVLEDADVETVAPAIARAAFRNSGQLCTARTRLLIQGSLADSLLPTLAHVTRSLEIGPGLEDKDLGPLVSRGQLERVHAYVAGAVEQGAEVLAGGRPAKVAGHEGGHFYEPTILDKVSASMPVASEEVFGPVLVVQTFETDDEAIALANATAFGLNGEIWTRDVARALRMGGRLDMGRVGINGDRAAVEVPMSGFKRSGVGVEKGLPGLGNYSRLKAYHVALGS